MKKLIVLPIMLSLLGVGIIGSSSVEAKGWNGRNNSEFLNRPKRRRLRPKPCNLCQPKPPKFCNLCQDRPVNFGTPMPRGGYQPRPGTQWR